MIERALYLAIQEGITYFAADTSRLAAVFQPEGDKTLIDDAELAKIRAMFADFASSARCLRHGYPTAPVEVPCYAIVLGSETVKQYLLHHEASALVDHSATPNTSTEYRGAIEDQTHNVFVYGIGADHCLYLHRILKFIILSRLSRLEELFCHEPRWSGDELQPMEMGLPHLVYRRVFSLIAMVEEYYAQVASGTLIGSTDIRRIEGGGGIEGVDSL